CEAARRVSKKSIFQPRRRFSQPLQRIPIRIRIDFEGLMQSAFSATPTCSRLKCTKSMPSQFRELCEAVVESKPRRGGRVAECGGLLNRCRGQNLYRGFESPPLRHRSVKSFVALTLRLQT